MSIHPFTHPFLPASHTQPTTLQAIFHLTNKPCPVFPHKGCLHHKQLLPYKLPVGAELIWSQWELLSNFLKGAKPGARRGDAQRLEGLS